MLNKITKSVFARVMLILTLMINVPTLGTVGAAKFNYSDPPGTLDITFDDDGLTSTAIGSYASGNALAIQEDGKIVVAGTQSNGYDNFGVVRYNEDGSLDTSFDFDGVVITNFNSYGHEVGQDVAIQEDDKIVVVGYSIDLINPRTIALARYNTDGSLDSSFGVGGKVTTDVGAYEDSGHSLAIQPDGKIVVAGYTQIGYQDYEIVLVRYNDNGFLDPTFGLNGVVGTSLRDTGADGGYIVAVQPNGMIVVGGTITRSFYQREFVLARYKTDGSLDTSFAIDGVAILSGSDFGGQLTSVMDVFLQAGKIILAGSDGGKKLFLARYNSDGTLDTTFDLDGKVVTDPGFDVTYGRLVVQYNGKIVVSGYGKYNDEYDFLLVRYNENGSLDTGFGIGGILFTDFGINQNDFARDIAIQTNGKLVVAGSRYNGSVNEFAVARYLGDKIVRYVKWNATGANNGSSWTDAYTDLQSALSAASSGDEIWVAAGTYKPGTLRTDSFQLKNGVTVYGGFAGTETVLSQRDWETNVTILSGDLNGNDNNNIDTTESTRADNSYHVLVGSITDNSAALDGFVVTGGNANEGDHVRGGGMYNYKGNPSVNNVIFSSNTALFGGGVSNYEDPTPYPVGSNPILTDVSFIGNSAVEGGGMHNAEFSSPILTNVTFENNTASRGGGGMENINYCDPVLTNVAFINNTAGAGGGMMNWNNNNSSLTNVTFYGNTAYWEVDGDIGGEGGGMYNHLGTPSMTNVTFNDNSAYSFGGGIYNNNSNPILSNVILWEDVAFTGAEIYNDTSSPVISDSVIQGGYAGGTNIITADPMLGTLGNYGGFTETIPLLAGSSAIDAGDDANCPATDQRGVMRPQGSQCDIGAYEYAEPTFADVFADHPYFQYIEILYANGYTGGCSTSPLLFCPDVSMSRAQSAVFMLRGNFGNNYVPVTPSHFFKDNWKNSSWGEGWAESMYLEGLTAGCSPSPLKFCPDEILTNVQLAVFGLRLKHGMAYPTPTAAGTVFADMTDTGFWGTGWAEQAYAEGLIPSCGTDVGTGKPKFCPNNLVSRGFGASVIVTAKNLTMP